MRANTPPRRLRVESRAAFVHTLDVRDPFASARPFVRARKAAA